MFKQEIIDKKFSRAFQGYDIAEVDYFLDELYRELSFRDREEDALHAQLQALRDELETLKPSMPEAENLEEVEELCFIEAHTQQDEGEADTGEIETSEITAQEEALEQDV